MISSLILVLVNLVFLVVGVLLNLEVRWLLLSGFSCVLLLIFYVKEYLEYYIDDKLDNNEKV